MMRSDSREDKEKGFGDEKQKRETEEEKREEKND